MQKKRRLSIGADTDKHFYLLEKETGNIPGIEACITKIDLNFTSEQIKTMAKKIEEQCEANGGKVPLQTLLLEIVNEGRIFNKVTEAKFISKHSSLYQFTPDMKIIIRPVINSDKSRLVNCIKYKINIFLYYVYSFTKNLTYVFISSFHASNQTFFS